MTTDQNSARIGMAAPTWAHDDYLDFFRENAYDDFARLNIILRRETRITKEEYNGLIPDLIAHYYPQNYLPVFFLEATTEDMVNEMINKSMIYHKKHPQAELYVYDYENMVLYKYDELEHDWISSEEYIIKSRFLPLEVLSYFEVPPRYAKFFIS